jgi:hypothetical protein
MTVVEKMEIRIRRRWLFNLAIHTRSVRLVKFAARRLVIEWRLAGRRKWNRIPNHELVVA